MEKESIYTLIIRFDDDCYVEQGTFSEIENTLTEVDEDFDGVFKHKYITDITKHELHDGEAILLKDGLPIVPEFILNVDF